MMDDPIVYLRKYLPEALMYYLDLIRGGIPGAFTRNRKISLSDLLLQMIDRRGNTQWAEIKEYYGFMNPKITVTDKGFFQARMKFNPEAVRVMSNEYIANYYDDNDDHMLKWKGLIILAIDGSKVTVPDTKENKEYFGTASGNSDNQPAMALLSTLHDALNNLKLDVLVDSISGSEQALAARHIDYYCDNYHQPALFTFDRGYFSIRLADRILARNQFFLFRVTDSVFTKYFDQVKVGESKVFEVTFDRKNTNQFRDDIRFRQHLMNTTYRLRFAKVVIGKDENGNDKVERLITNLPEERISDKDLNTTKQLSAVIESFTTDELKDCYWLRWGTETSYSRLKNRMKMEEFSGYKPHLILQDFYADAWMFNLVSLKINQANANKPVEQKEDGEYTISRNFNKAIGTMKHLLLKALISPTEEERAAALKAIDRNIEGNLMWVKNGDRQFDRKKPVNKSRMSYRNTY